MEVEEAGYWYLKIDEANVGDEYRYVIHNGDQILWRIDPYAREVTNSIRNAVVHDPAFDWEGDDFQLPTLNELVIYELHVGTFAAEKGALPAELGDVTSRFDHLKRLGVNVLRLMPMAEFAGDFSWGYNPSNIFAVESSYAGPKALKSFVKEAHEAGFGVILEVVYNHFWPSDLDHSLWQFDGWSENGNGGVYFYSDWRAETPWGATRLDYGRGEVRRHTRDNAVMGLEEYHIDGLRYDMTLFMRSVRGDESDPGVDLPDGWGLAQWMNREIREQRPGRIAIAEDLQTNAWLTKSGQEGGAGFHTQWDANFVHPIRSAVALPEDAYRSIASVRDAICFCCNDDPFQRVIYSESHDKVANGKQRAPSEVAPSDGENYCAQKLSTLAAALMFTAPGLPMLFQGQELLQGGWFTEDAPLDWAHGTPFSGIVAMYRDLTRLLLNREGNARGLCGRGVDVFHVDEDHKALAFHRWDEGGPQDDVVVAVNLSHELLADYRIALPRPGVWRIRFNSDASA